MDAGRILEKAEKTESANGHRGTAMPLPHFHPEASTFNLESTPAGPYGLGIEDLLGVEADMARRSGAVPKEDGAMALTVASTDERSQSAS